MIAILKIMEYEFPDLQVHVHFGWPLSSWLDRIAVGVMVFNMMKLPKMFSNFIFNINYPGKMYESKKTK
jgi:hypothetical protein